MPCLNEIVPVWSKWTSLFEGNGQFVLGWISGILAAVATQGAKDILKARRFRKAVEAELLEVRFRAISILMALAKGKGQLNRAKLEWLHLQSQRCAEGYDRNIFQKYIKSFLEMDDTGLATALAPEQDTRMSKSVAMIEIPMLLGSAQLVLLLNTDEQIAISKIISKIKSVNSKIEDLAYWIKASHGTVSDENHESILFNSDSAYQSIVGGCDHIISAIESFPSIRSKYTELPLFRSLS